MSDSSAYQAQESERHLGGRDTCAAAKQMFSRKYDVSWPGDSFTEQLPLHALILVISPTPTLYMALGADSRLSPWLRAALTYRRMLGVQGETMHFEHISEASELRRLWSSIWYD